MLQSMCKNVKANFTKPLGYIRNNRLQILRPMAMQHRQLSNQVLKLEVSINDIMV